MKITLKKIGDIAIPSTDSDRELWEKFSDAEYEVDMKNLDSRTVAQNKSLHKWCDQISNLLNNEALYMTGIFNDRIEWKMLLVKEQIFKGSLQKLYGINSTTKMKRKELNGVIDYITNVFGLQDIEIPKFPSKELWKDK